MSEQGKSETFSKQHSQSSEKKTEECASTDSLDAADEQKEEWVVGSYQILRSLGEGGMGTVYLAVRADQEFKKYVAIKVIREGRDSEEIIARFRRERQILAALDHPNIAKLLDGGTTEKGLPYFIMEYIQGRPLDEYCDSHKLTTKERLELFRTACNAVQFAHQNLVVHRDLKPANILVTSDGVPKLLDFGIAKLLNPSSFAADAPPTATDLRAMTPEYASPEQVKGDPITTASDVYSLGVVLYELLSGNRPYRITGRNPGEIYSAVCEQEPPKPSTAVTSKENADTGRVSAQRSSTPEKLHRELRGDLDNIILMALRKEPQRRYASAQALSEDIGRYLQGDPVQARKGTWSYRTGKYIRRNKVTVAGMTAVFSLLVASAAITTIQNARIAEQRDIAQRQKEWAFLESQKAEKVTNFLVDMFKANEPEQARGETVTARQILDMGSARIITEFRDQPELQAKLLEAMGSIYLDLGLYDRANPLLENALRVRKHFYGDQHLAVSESLEKLGDLFYAKGQYQEAEKDYRAALEMRRKLLGNEDLLVARSLDDLGLLLLDSAKAQERAAMKMAMAREAEKFFRESLDMRRKLLGTENVEVAKAMEHLGRLLLSVGEDEEAAKLYRDSLSMLQKLSGDESIEVAKAMDRFAYFLFLKGDPEQSENFYRKAIALKRKLLGDVHPEVAYSLRVFGWWLHQIGRMEEAEKCYDDAITIQVKIYGGKNPEVARIQGLLAKLLQDKGDVKKAEELYREAIAVIEPISGNGSIDLIGAKRDLAFLLQDTGNITESKTLFSQIKLPFVPPPLSPRNGQFFEFQSDEPLKIELRWRDVVDAARYHVQISENSLFGKVIAENENLTKSMLLLEIPKTSKKQYFWRVRCVDKQGAKSPWSSSSQFVVQTRRDTPSHGLGDDTTPPPITITNIHTYFPYVQVVGNTEADAFLTINGEVIDVKDDGSFAYNYLLRKTGENILEFVAEDPAGNRTPPVKKTVNYQ